MEPVRWMAWYPDIDDPEVVVGQCLDDVTTKPTQAAGDCNQHPVLPARRGFMHAVAVRCKS